MLKIERKAKAFVALVSLKCSYLIFEVLRARQIRAKDKAKEQRIRIPAIVWYNYSHIYYEQRENFLEETSGYGVKQDHKQTTTSEYRDLETQVALYTNKGKDQKKTFSYMTEVPRKSKHFCEQCGYD